MKVFYPAAGTVAATAIVVGIIVNHTATAHDLSSPLYGPSYNLISKNLVRDQKTFEGANFCLNVNSKRSSNVSNFE